MWDETIFQALLNSNDRPSDSMIPAIHQKMIKPTEKIAAIDREIDDLNRQLEKLEEECHQVEMSISHYQTIVAPMRLLPDDILRQIFFHSVLLTCSDDPQNHNAFIVPERLYPGPDQWHLAPILLTRICKRWRDIAFTTPELWSRISFFLPVVYPPIADDDNNPSSHIWQTAMQRSLEQLGDGCLPEVVDAWLSRSGATPLLICIPRRNTVDTHYGPEAHPEMHQGVTRLFKALVKHAHQWKKLHLNMNVAYFSSFNTHLSQLDVQQLRNLECLEFPCYIDNSVTSPLLTDLPSLRSLVWRALEGNTFTRPYGARVWNNLTDVCITEFADINNTLMILEGLCLVNCHLVVSDSRQDPWPASRRLIMPRIQNLSLSLTPHGTYNELLTRTEMPVYHISAPTLRTLNYDSEGEMMSLSRFGSYQMHTFPAFPLGGIIDNAPCLKELELVAAAAAMDEIERALKLPKVAIERLVVGPRRAVQTINLEENKTVTTCDLVFQRVFAAPEWCSLTTESTETELMKVIAMDQEVLKKAFDNCPCSRLKHLEFLSLETVTDDEILSLVIYRLRLYKHALSLEKDEEDHVISGKRAVSSRLVVPLCFKFDLARERDHGITPHVERFAELMDMKSMYQLTLRYNCGFC
ncbi:hypothetical protein CVT24_001528 [Panaeolus cyanescens]|uniref:Uncharacterized protein n=1 Tax=Panaeolus cyanescens TaxID=181874 RepID=A0A409YFC5_9AGAR|nr:hypothetical protein CVT24_001528 [Panaeolus cyanescens]